MDIRQYRKQIQTVLLIEATIAVLLILGIVLFWSEVCTQSFISCLHGKPLTVGNFLLFATLRPFVLTPLNILTLMAGHTFGPVLGTLVSSIGGLCACLVVYLIAKQAGKLLIGPWLSNNLPQTVRFLRSQDWKVVLATRLIPFFPFDLLTLGYGLLDLRFRYVMLCTFLGSLPEIYIFAALADPKATYFQASLTTVSVMSVLLLPGLIIEFYARKNGTGMWWRFKAMMYEIYHELRRNNDIVKRQVHDPKKIPVLLLYGFFSSRRSLLVLEKILSERGYQVISFNLGGLLEVFFTRSITDTAEFIDKKLKRQFERHQMSHIHIVAHSKGGLVALWWLLRMGGHRHCKTLVTLGTPFRGSMLTWIALVTPLGFIFRDMWQMRPGSQFLQELHASKVPSDVQIYTIYSNRDGVAQGDNGIFHISPPQPNVIAVPMHNMTHFQFLYRREVGDMLARILGSPYLPEAEKSPSTTESAA